MASFTVEVLEMVKKYPMLYDIKHPDYRNIAKREMRWKEIGLRLNKSGKQFYLKLYF